MWNKKVDFFQKNKCNEEKEELKNKSSLRLDVAVSQGFKNSRKQYLFLQSLSLTEKNLFIFLLEAFHIYYYHLAPFYRQKNIQSIKHCLKKVLYLSQEAHRSYIEYSLFLYQEEYRSRALMRTLTSYRFCKSSLLFNNHLEKLYFQRLIH